MCVESAHLLPESHRLEPEPSCSGVMSTAERELQMGARFKSSVCVCMGGTGALGCILEKLPELLN